MINHTIEKILVFIFCFPSHFYPIIVFYRNIKETIQHYFKYGEFPYDITPKVNEKKFEKETRSLEEELNYRRIK